MVQKTLDSVFQTRKPLPYQHVLPHEWMCGQSHCTDRVACWQERGEVGGSVPVCTAGKFVSAKPYLKHSCVWPAHKI